MNEQLQFEAAQSTTLMTEIDLRRDNRNPGIPLDPLVVGRDIYRLLAIFGASSLSDLGVANARGSDLAPV